MNKIVIIDSSHENRKEIDEIIDMYSKRILSNNIEAHPINVTNLRIVSCTQCKVCMQTPGETPKKCFHYDSMHDIIDIIEDSDSFIFINDTNSMFDSNKIFKKFTKRLAAYHYWPYGSENSALRKKNHTKNSILINYDTTLGLFSNSFGQLTLNSMAIGAMPVAKISVKPTKDSNNFLSKYEEEFESSYLKLFENMTQ